MSNWTLKLNINLQLNLTRAKVKTQVLNAASKTSHCFQTSPASCRSLYLWKKFWWESPWQSLHVQRTKRQRGGKKFSTWTFKAASKSGASSRFLANHQSLETLTLIPISNFFFSGLTVAKNKRRNKTNSFKIRDLRFTFVNHYYGSM